ncbi:MAG: phage tail protein [Sphingomonadaceae bacterium]
MVMMSLGYFLFTLQSLPFQKMAHKRDVRFANNERFGAADAWQFIGPGQEAISLSGVSAYGITSAKASSARLNSMMQDGRALPLIDGLGNLFGQYILTSFDLDKTVYQKFGQARRVAWTLELQRVDDPGASIGNVLLDKAMSMARDLTGLKNNPLSIFGKGLGI